MKQGLLCRYVMFARTTRGQDRSINGGRLLRVEKVVSGSTSTFIITIKMQADEKYFLGAASVISRPVCCRFSSAGKHFLHLKTFVMNTRLKWIFFLPFAG